MEHSGYEEAAAAQLNMVTVYGLNAEPSNVTVNNVMDSSFTWDPDNKVTPHVSTHMYTTMIAFTQHILSTYPTHTGYTLITHSTY